ncbi:MAG: site-specific DNA-methyltransferase [Ammonifex sp.]|jgi:adenine-specific DNA-methyltransferase|nr:MAG: site-specific DNA-methyltransferase [Ammonifex sp.]
MTKEKKFYRALKDIFVGAKVEGDSGYINLMRVKSWYFEKGVFPRLQQDIEEALKLFPDFRDELFDKLYTFFGRYFSESGSIYFRYTPLHQNVYEKVYTDDKDVMLFWKTHMLYYVKTDRLFRSMDVEVDGHRFFFDVSVLEHKRSNEKRALVFDFKEKRGDGVLAFTVTYSERGRKTKIDEIRRKIKDALNLNRYTDDVPSEDTLERVFRLFERQSEVDYFINKDARAFLREQFDLWLYQYVFSGKSQWTETRIRQLQALKDIAYKIIDFISQFEDELVRIWNKPKFVLHSNYVITLDRIAGRDVGLLDRILAHPGMAQQEEEWRRLGMVGEDFRLEGVWQQDLLGRQPHGRYQYLPIDTKYFKDLELDILALFEYLDQELDGWLIKSENYQALNTLLPKFRERVKCIYIDPPYNTDASEIMYANDYRDSSWLSLIANRLEISTRLLARNGMLCVTIDDFELFRLRGLLSGMFGDEYILGTVVIRSNPAGRSTAKGFSISHEYAVFVTNSLEASIGRIERTPEQIARYDQKDGKGYFEWVNFRKHGGANAMRTARPRLFYPIYITQNSLRIPPMQWDEHLQEWIALEKPTKEETVVFPISPEGEERTWKWGHETARERIADLTVRPDQQGELGIYMKSRLRGDGRLPPTWWEKSSYSATDHGTNLLKNLFGEGQKFSFPKSVHATTDCIRVASPDNSSIILDFFAGSGTTAHAVINLNREDGGKRKYILVEMADYFDTVLLPRVKKVAFSDKWKDGKAQNGQGISHFIKYYELEQYEDVLRRACYEDADLFDNPYQDPYSQYVFLRDKKLLDNRETGEKVVELDIEKEEVRVDVSKLYEGIDLAETLSCVTGKWIKRITAEYVEFEDEERADLRNPDWRLVKPLIWW